MTMHDRLLDLAEDLSRTRGLDAFSYADLARATGVTKAAIHHHFPTKASLSLAVLERYSETFLAALEALEGSAQERLAGFVALYRGASNGGSQLCLCVSYGSAPESLSPEVREGVAAFHRDVTAWLERTLQEAGRAPAEAPMILATVEGAQLIARATGNAAAFDAATHPLLTLLET
ncbi:MAG: TetR/AcrR family transcriptional regulator [Pseudomonadota bacterium]